MTAEGGGAAEADRAFEVNGHDVPCTERQYAVMELLAEAPEGQFVAHATVLAIYDNRSVAWMAEKKPLDAALARAGAKIMSNPRHGHRLVNVDG